jgi:hypothetical protein
VTSIAKLIAFLIFALICLLIARSRDEGKRRRLVLLLIAYFVLAQLELGFTQADAWPFSPYRMMHGIARLDVDLWRVGFFGVDSQGREWRVDPFAWEGVPDWYLQFYFMTKYKQQDDASRRIALAHLYKLAERYRAEIVERGSLPPASSLGIAGAPQMWIFRREPAVPHERYRAFRVYREDWLTQEKLADPRRQTRQLLGEYRPQ